VTVEVPAPLISLDDPRARELPVAGGKAASLARLLAAGLPVPPGAVLPAGQELTEQARVALEQAIEQLVPSGGALAVRSSARLEDGLAASFAGQFATVLDVKDKAALLAAVRACRASYAGPGAAEYLRAAASRESCREKDLTPPFPIPPPVASGRSAPRRGDGAERILGAVLLQRQIPARWAGVCFTADPQSGLESLTVIEAVRGPGAALVSGSAAPAYLRIDRRSGRLVAWRNMREDVRERDRLLGLAWELDGLGRRARAALDGAPLDIEWAWDGAQLWLLQARPITQTTFALPQRQPVSEPEVWTHGNFAETMPGPIPPLAWDVMREALSGAERTFGTQTVARELNSEVLEYIAGRVCWHLSPLASADLLSRLMLRKIGSVDANVGEAVARLLAGGDWAPQRIPSARLRAALMLGLAGLGLRSLPAMARAWRRGRERTLADMAQSAQQLLAATGAEPLAGLSAAEVWRRARALLRDFWPALEPHLGAMNLLGLPLLYANLAARWSGCSLAEAAGAALDLEPTWVRRMEGALKRLGEKLGAAGVAQAATADELPETLRVEYQAFAREFGHRGPGEQDISQPRLAERPEVVIALALRACSRLAAPVAHPAADSRRPDPDLVLPRVAARGLLGPCRAAVLRLLRPPAQHWAPLREQTKHVFWMPVWQRLRALILRVGQALHEGGHIARAEDVFLFYCDELDVLCADPGGRPGRPAHRARPCAEATSTMAASPSPSARPSGKPPAQHWAGALAAERRRQMERWARLDFPAVLRSDGVPVPLGAAPSDGVWTGVGISAGVHQGPARVALSFEQAQALEPGEVLVVPAVDPGWTPLFLRAGALVMEVGGVLSHGAVIARELGLPAVAGVAGLTRTCKTGQWLQVDGKIGTVTYFAPCGKGNKIKEGHRK
jgi:pyruvate,water dikinase